MIAIVKRVRTAVALVALVVLSRAAAGEDAPSFTQGPTVQRDGDQVTIGFEVQAFGDVTVVIERADGRILRHLASGVLGTNAPAPFQRDSRKQAIVWDGKDDAGAYVDELRDAFVRVSLGLRTRFERTLFWSPFRRQSRAAPLAAATEEGVYVYDGGSAGLDHVKLLDHDGNYVRTVYPFPADRIRDVRGIAWHEFPEGGGAVPVKPNFLQSTLLTSGLSGFNTQTYDRGRKIYDSGVGIVGNAHFGMNGTAASAIAARAGRIALVQARLNRLGTAGDSAGLPLEGPETAVTTWPKSVALDPQGKWLYLTGYIFGKEKTATQDIRYMVDWSCAPVVMRLNMETDGKMERFKGTIGPDAGPEGAPFKVPCSVAVDAAGRVYIADHIADSVFVFGPDGALLKTLPVARPGRVCIHPRTGDIYVFSFKVMNAYDHGFFPGTLIRFGPFENPKELERWPLGRRVFTNQYAARYRTCGLEFFVELDGWTDPPTIWMTSELGLQSVATRESKGDDDLNNWVLLTPRNGRLEEKRVLADDAARSGVPPRVQPHQRQRLHVNPANGHVYVSEGDFAASGKSFARLYEIDPETGIARAVEIPFHAEDMCFDLNGLAYLRTVNVVARYDPAAGWREVPWDYGEERSGVGFGWMSGMRRAQVRSGVVMPSDGNWHHGGLHVSPRGHLVAACYLGFDTAVKTNAKYVHADPKYRPKVYPGRLLGGRGGATTVHVFDRHGKIVHEDVVPGLGDLYGIALDRDGSLYVMSAATRLPGGKRYFNDMTGTLMKLRPGASRVLSDSKGVPIPLTGELRPGRPPEVQSAMQGAAWVEKPEWLFGGVGWGGKNRGNGCACSNYRFAHDYLARTFVPEMDRCSVAVLDSAGNLILRLGAYGNVEDGRPLVAEGGPPRTRAVGGAEVALFRGAYLGTDTDRRLFIADAGNGRILSVKLDYAAGERLPLGDHAEGKKEAR